VRYLPAEIPQISTHPNSVVPQRRSIEDLISAGACTKAVAPPKEQGKLVVLNSGTTGTPKVARRRTPPGFGAIAAMLSRMPLRRDEVMLLTALVFHTWGLAALQLSTPGNPPSQQHPLCTRIISPMSYRPRRCPVGGGR
jgi:hypothetical protein